MSFSPEISTLIADGAKLYAAQEFEQSADKYAEACQVYNEQAEADNADLLFLYGKTLFQAAVSKSEVFGGSAEQNDDENENEDAKTAKESGMFQFSEDVPLAEEEDDAFEKAAEEENSEEEEEPEGEDQTDFEVAWEILDLARTLFEKQLHDAQKEAPAAETVIPLLKSDTEEPVSPVVTLKKKLSETYDLLGEVSLEAENFKQAALDFEQTLVLRLELYPALSSLVSESHYKLSLALEFCVDDATARARAVEQMELALVSVKARIELSGELDDELVQDLEDRVAELKKDPVAEMEAEKLRIMQGILGEATGEEKPVSSAPVNDLTGMVKKRKAPVNTLEVKKVKK
ncbi:hypothetical protein BABINDRAFT_36049 [Babjeviella inositovora NRRL Y-12698]|uniref:Tetratricopeptide SHNi-TPR domain-containing protein n=1 Tax=Babjeviella inositovora NRRL Y-12698 TaxID=984486 RepID=A0A1E3QQP1_9ASCO|nr:uncharacterized protein BABINDRAFT_36049 [Babjeviella inositovora NRRL Y-12698]ODQ80016.1 hypothetical protein BABINDRAFT_36049 [Babjeviella inositovora NRRL Y-12698]